MEQWSDGRYFSCALKAAENINCLLSIESWLNDKALHYTNTPILL